ncbi:MAG: fumarate hydratase [Candidatus Micrarchaeota archaeon]
MYLQEILYRLVQRGVSNLPKDVEGALKLAYGREKNTIARANLGLILKNVALARRTSTPICQDTGVPVFYVSIGRRCDHVFDVEGELKHAVRNATHKSLLRPNIVDPISRINSNDNSGGGMPVIHYSLFDGNHIEITYVPKGAGTENMASLHMLKPSSGEKEIEELVLKRVKTMGGRPCPPYILGIGIGGTSERALELAKTASIRQIGKKNHDPKIRKFENRLLSRVNSTGIGPMGLGGKTTALAVHIESAYCHTATMPVGIALSCWADRRASIALRRHGHAWMD